MNKIKYIFLVSLFFFISIFIFYNFIHLYKDNRINNILDSHTNKLQTYYEILSFNQKTTADVTYKETMHNKKFIQVLKEANNAKNSGNTKLLKDLRDKAKKMLSFKYGLYKKQGILQYHFVFPDNTAFLRMHKVGKFGDDLSNVRTDFAYANKHHKIVRGFAQGRTSHAFRNVYPIIDKDENHLGAMEVSFSSELIQNYFTKVNKLHTHFLVRKDIFKSHAWKRDDLILKYHPSTEHENYMITMTGDHSINKCIKENSIRIDPNREEITRSIEESKKFSVYTIFEKKARVTSFFPILHNITKEPVAWIVSYVKEPLIDETIQTGYIMYIMVFIILFIVFTFIYFLLNQKNLLDSKVKEKTKDLSILNKDLEKSEHQLQLINENLEIKIKEEVDKSKEKDKVLFEQAKMAALGEMIGNIAHQWRQPLSVISTSASGMEFESEMGILDHEKIKENCKRIDKNAQYLSRTIDDFRNFIIGKSKKEHFNLKKTIDSFLRLVESYRKDHDIKVISNIPEDIEIESLRNELNQCLINLFNNSKDAMVENNIEPKIVIIESDIIQNSIQITFKDNGGGIDENIINKIFEPYFTTKHQSIGTGLGLNMTYRLITEGMGGSISVSNEDFIIEDEKFYGAKFVITIPLKKDED